MNDLSSRILYEDNHIIIVDKLAGELVQKDKSTSFSLIEELTEFIKKRDNKPGNVFIGLPHRLDRPTSGIVVFAKTSKALSRLSVMFANSEVDKTYIVLTENTISDKDFDYKKHILTDYIYRNSEQNKSYICNKNKSGAKKAILEYTLLKPTDNYYLYSVHLLTGRHHQIRCQFSSRSAYVKGDLKYGAKRSNPDKSICLHSHIIKFIHPVSKKLIEVKSYPHWGIEID